MRCQLIVYIRGHGDITPLLTNRSKKDEKYTGPPPIILENASWQAKIPSPNAT